MYETQVWWIVWILGTRIGARTQN